MCLAIFAPKASLIDLDGVRRAGYTNNDGCGLIWNVPNVGLQWLKGLTTEQCIEKIQEMLANGEDYATAVHLRFATHGGKSNQLTHPFPLVASSLSAIEGDGAHMLMHNGTIPDRLLTPILSTVGDAQWRSELIAAMKANTVSDTYVLAQIMSFLTNEQMGSFLTYLTGENWSRYLLWFNGDPSPYLYSTDWKKQANGVWLSNNTSGYNGYAASYGSYYEGGTYTKVGGKPKGTSKVIDIEEPVEEGLDLESLMGYAEDYYFDGYDYFTMDGTLLMSSAQAKELLVTDEQDIFTEAELNQYSLLNG